MLGEITTKQKKKIHKTSDSKQKSNFDKMKNLIETETKRNLQSIVVPLDLIEYAGETQKAVFLARLIYLSDKGIRKDGFIWKTYDEWKAETGLSKAQVERIVADFQDNRGILQTKKMMASSKNRNASNTYHYKLLIDSFLTDFENFLVVRSKKNLKFEPEETSHSITENTIINTSEISLSEKNKISEENSNNQKVTEENSDGYVTSDFVDNYNDKDDVISAEDSFDVQKVSLPDDFEPTLANQVWAIKTYFRKYLKPITEKFIKKYKERTYIKETLEGWQDKWREWVNNEKQFGIDLNVVNTEHDEIENVFLNLVYQTVGQINFNLQGKKREFFLVPTKALIMQLCENDDFESDYVIEALNDLVRSNYVGNYFGYYYDLKKYESNSRYAEKVDLDMNWYGENYIDECQSILKFFREKLILKPEEVIKEFYYINPKFIEKFLKVRQEFGKLKSIEGYLHEDDIIGTQNWFEYWDAIKSALKEKGITLPDDIYGSDEDDEEFDESSFEFQTSYIV